MGAPIQSSLLMKFQKTLKLLQIWASQSESLGEPLRALLLSLCINERAEVQDSFTVFYCRAGYPGPHHRTGKSDAK